MRVKKKKEMRCQGDIASIRPMGEIKRESEITEVSDYTDYTDFFFLSTTNLHISLQHCVLFFFKIHLDIL